MRVFSTRLVAATAICWGALVWGNWLVLNPAAPGRVWHALTALASVRPGPAVAALGGVLPQVGRMILLGLAALGAGAPALSWLLRDRDPRSMAPFAPALGAGLAALGVLGAGFLGLAFAPLAWGAVVAAAIGGGLRGRVRAWRWPVAAEHWPLALLIVLAGGCALLGSLAPEISFDALAHHLAHPQLYAAAHKVVGLPHHFLSHYPALLEMQYLLAFLLGGGAPLAKLIHFGWGMLTVAALADWARDDLEDAWVLAAVAGFLLLPYVQIVLMWAYVDLGAAAYLTLALRAALFGPAGAVLAGSLAGLCMGVKATGIFAPVLVLLLLRPARRAWGRATAATALAALPWAVKNWAFTGNPAAPFLSGWLPTLWWSTANQARYGEELRSYAPGAAWPGVGWLTQPWRTSVRNEGVLDAMGGMGGWFLWALPLLLLVEAPAGRWPALATLGYFALWLCIPRQSRYLLPVWPAAAVAATHAVRGLARRRGLALVPVWGAGALLVMHLGRAAVHEHDVINPEPVVFGAETPDQYLARGLPEKPYCVRIARKLAAHDPGGRLLVVSQYGLALLWGGTAVTQSVFDTPLIERWATAARDGEDLLKKFRQAGVRRILYSTTGGFSIQHAYRMYAFSPAAADRWRAFWTSRAGVEVNQDDRFLLVRLGAGRVAGGERGGRRPGAGVLPGLDEQWLADADARMIDAERAGTVAGVLAGMETVYRQIAAETRSPAAWERLGSVRLRGGDLSGARAACEEAERLGRGSSVLYDALGVIEARTGDPGPAMARFRQALAIEPELEDARRNLARMLWQHDNRSAALGVVREGLVLNPGSGDLRSLWLEWTGQSLPLP